MLRLFVGNLPHACDEASLTVWFDERGHRVSFSQVVRDQATGHSRGFGFVELQSASNLQETIKALHGQSMAGRVLTVNAATPKLPRGGERHPQVA